jgi:hypothetical protein
VPTRLAGKCQQGMAVVAAFGSPLFQKIHGFGRFRWREGAGKGRENELFNFLHNLREFYVLYIFLEIWHSDYYSQMNAFGIGIRTQNIHYNIMINHIRKKLRTLD